MVKNGYASASLSFLLSRRYEKDQLPEASCSSACVSLCPGIGALIDQGGEIAVSGYKFVQFFHADAAQREDEETRVHQLTYEILRTSQAPDLPLILEFYSNHREKVD